MNFAKGIMALFSALFLTIALLTAGIVIALNMTILNPDFIAKEIDRLDIYELILDQIQGDLQAQETYGLIGGIALDSMVENILEEAKPWLEEQTEMIIYKGLAYIKGQEDLNIVISLTPLKSAIEAQISKQISSLLPPELGDIPVGIDIPSLFDLTGIPDQYVINEASLDQGIVDYLHAARKAVEYLKLAYVLSIGIAILSIIGIGWSKQWRIKATTRYLATPYILSGIACTVMAVAIRISNAISKQFADSSNMIFNFQSNLMTMIADITRPLLVYGIILLAIGIALAIFAFIYKEPEWEPA
jgi:hypothetical protein